MKLNADHTTRFAARKVVSFALVLTLLLTMFNVGAIAQVVLNLGYGTPTAGSSLKITWNEMDDADHYEYSVRNTTTDELIYDHKSTTSRSFTISGKYLLANNSYRVWVGAYRPEDVGGWPPSTHTAEWEFTVPDDTCDHDGKTYQDIIKKVYKSVSDTQHRVTTTYDLCCCDCNEVLKENQVLEEIDDHFLDENGDCKLCDYTYSCPHTESKVDVENTGYLPEDEDIHIYFETGHYVCANANCAKEIKPYYYEEEEEHTFNNNICKYCGYTKSEPLSITVARGQQTTVAGESISATVTTKGGSGSFNYAWEVICDGTIVDRTDYSMSTDYSYVTTKAGNWQFKVYVKDTVGKEEVTATTSTITVSEATCNHTNKKNETIDTDYIKTSDTKHEIRTYYNVVCNDCGDVLSAGNYSSEIVDHVVGASGRCVCGYTAPAETCEHTTSKPVQIDQRTEQYDEKWHKVITTYQDICANNDCGVILVASREETAMVAHTYDSNGQCTCGYVQPTDKCDHAPIETLVDTSYVEIDGTGHKIIRKYHYECECGQVNYDEDAQSFDPHVYEGRICKLCGFEDPCDHADFQKVISSVVEDDKNSDSTHFVVTTYTKTCACGAVNPTPIVRTTVPCNFTKSAGVQAKHESQGHQYFDRCACGNAVVNGKFKNYLSSCATCQQLYGDDALAKGTYNSSRVEELQQMLGFTGSAVDGDFGGNTESAVKEFQKKHGLPVTGIVDDATWAKLIAENKQEDISTSPDDVNDEKHTHVYENGVCSDCGETCKHAYGAYYDDNLVSHQFCINCEPRTDTEKARDIENLERYVNKMKADLARDNVTSLNDPASILLSAIKEQNETWYVQVFSYAYKTASFQWGDVVKKAVPGSTAVDEVRRESIQASVAATLATSTSYDINSDDQLEFENALLEMAGLTIENSDTVLDVAGHINDITGLGTDMYNRFGGLNFNILGQFTKYETVRASLPTNAQIKDQFVNKSGGMKAGVVLTAVGFAIDCGVDIGEYASWSEKQRELFYATTEQAAENVAFLEELMATYPDDDVLVEYCKDTIEGIERSMNNDVSNWITEAGDWINNAAETGGDIAKIVMTNGVEATTNFALPAAFAVVFQTGGSALTLAGTGAGLVAEWTVGTDTTVDSAEDIDILYTYVVDSVDAYNSVENSNSVSEDVKRFQEFNILNMKIAGLEMAADINKGVNAETANGIIASYEKYRQDLLLGE